MRANLKRALAFIDGPRLLRDRPEQAGQGIDEANEVKVEGTSVRIRNPARR